MGTGASTNEIQISDINDYYNNLKGCKIPKTEERGITINQLEMIGIEIKVRCVKEGWTDIDGQLLTPERVNLYVTKDKIIKYRTVNEQCSFVELISSEQTAHQELEDEDEIEGSDDENSEDEASLNRFLDYFRLEEISTEGKHQAPRWFVSHYWEEPVLSMIKCLKQHAQDRGLDHNTPYWICAYANNQWILNNEISADPSNSSFRRAMRICEGTVSIVDEQCETYKRIWCIYEYFVSVTENSNNYKLDMYTECHWEDWEGRKYEAVGITDGFIESELDAVDLKTRREYHFPIDRVKQALSLDVKLSKASEPSDLRHIKNAITGNSLENVPLDTHYAYESLNHFLRGRFLHSSFQTLINQDPDNLLKYCELLKNSSIKQLEWKIKDLLHVQSVVESLPESIRQVCITFSEELIANGDEACFETIFSILKKYPFIEYFWVDMGYGLTIYDCEKVFLTIVSSMEEGHPSVKIIKFFAPNIYNNKRLDINHANITIESIKRGFPKLKEISIINIFDKKAIKLMRSEMKKIKNITYSNFE